MSKFVKPEPSPEPTEDRVATEGDKPSPFKAAEVDPSIQGLLGRKLRESYDALVNEEVPDKFRDLLEQLKEKERHSKDGT